MNKLPSKQWQTPPFPERIQARNPHILVVDDNVAIHSDFRKILGADDLDEEFESERAEIFGESEAAVKRVGFELDFAFQGDKALELVQGALNNGWRYAMAFMDLRMPPGWDGVQTTLNLWKADPDLQIVFCTAYSDYSWEQMMGMLKNPERVLILKKPFDTIEVLQLAHGLTEKWSLFEAARRNADDLNRAVEIRTSELQAANLLLHSEIEKHKAATEHIRNLLALIENAREAILVWNMDGRIGFWNHGAEAVYGWSAKEAIGRKVAELLLDDLQGSEIVRARAAVLETGRWTGELNQRTKNGHTITTECRLTLTRDEHGNPKSVLGIISDVTEKKQIEAQFLHSQRLESIGALTGGIAHDLNNILSPIIMTCDLLSPVAERDQHLVGILRKSAQRGSELLRQMLSFARGAGGDRVRLEIKLLIREVEKVVTETFPKDISVLVDLAADLWPIVADPTQMHQVLMNLCVNARDAMPGGGQLTLRACNRQIENPWPGLALEAKPGRFVLISVSDSGTGMSADVREKIFDPFFTTKGIGKGTGLGLSTTMNIIKSHGGLIEVETEQGKGSTFHVFLPVTEDAAPASVEPEDGSVLPRGRGETILVVDDELFNLLLAQKILEASGYRVLTAKDGLDALDVYMRRQKAIAAVLMDIMMPVMDGLTAIRSLTEMNPAVKIIAISGLKEESWKDKAAQAGVRHFLPRPCTRWQLLYCVHEILNEKEIS